MPDPLQSLFRAFTQQARVHTNRGEHGKAAGLALIAIGIFTLPVPIIGLPLIGFGIWKLCTSA
jgi:hypothetical protein